MKKEKYEIHIKKYENGKPVAGLVKDFYDLDELIKTIDKLVERLRPIDDKAEKKTSSH